MRGASNDRQGDERPNGSLTERGQMLADVSNAIVRIHKQFYGKGPVRARAHISEDLLTVILEGGFTRSEQTLNDHGHEREVLSSRLAMQGAVESEFRAAVEKILYRSVRSFMSANDPSNDLQAEIFVLEPRGSEELGDEQEQVAVQAQGEQDGGGEYRSGEDRAREEQAQPAG
jgi:uncharacterized protein YbcI